MAVAPAELLDAVEDLRPALGHLDTLGDGLTRIEAAPDPAAARQRAFELGDAVPGLHALGLLLQTNAPERALLLEQLTHDVALRVRCNATLQRIDASPTLQRALAAAHPALALRIVLSTSVVSLVTTPLWIRFGLKWVGV